MGNPKGKGGKKFPPGQSGNPSGRPPLPEFIKERKRLTTSKFIDALHNLCDLEASIINELADDMELPIKMSIMANWLRSARVSDAERQSLFNRLFGKVKESVEITVPKPTIIRKSDGSTVELGARLEKDDGFENQDENVPPFDVFRK